MRDALATLVEIARRVAKLPRGVVVRTTLLGAACSMTVCMLGLGIALAAAVIAEGHAKVRRGGEDWRAREIGPALLLVVTCFVGWFVGIVSGTVVDGPGPRVLGALLGSAAFGVLVAPLRLAAGAGNGSFGDALVRSLAALGSHPARLIAVGVVDGVCAWGLASAILAMTAGRQSAGSAMVGTLVFLVLGMGTSFVWPLAAYDVCVRDEAPLATLRAPRLRSVVLVLAPGLVLASIATMVELARPLGAWSDQDVTSAPIVAARDIGTSYPSEPVEVGTPSGLRVVAIGPRTIEVSTADGGGCGEITVTSTPLYPPTLGGRLEVRTTTFRGQPAFALGPWRSGGAVAFVDAEGVRLDDTLADRFHARVDRVAQALFALAALLVLALVLTTLRSARTAAALGATPLAAAADASWVVLCGRVRLDGGRVRLDTDGVHVEGEVQFEGGGRVFAIPPGRYAAARPEAPVGDGAEAFVVAPARALKSEGYRLAPRAEAELFGLGTIDDARAHFLARDAQRLVWLAVPACAALLAYAAWLVVPP